MIWNIISIILVVSAQADPMAQGNWRDTLGTQVRLNGMEGEEGEGGRERGRCGSRQGYELWIFVTEIP